MAEIVPNRVPCGKKVTPTPPQPEPTPVTLCDITGIKYFKLQSQIPGDYTKNCGLLGNEIDENFYFLRSMDIKTAYTIDEEGRKILVLERVNCGREIKVDITDDDAYQFRLEDGYMYITFPDGHEEKIGRFLVEGDNVHIVTDASIQGDGSYGNPIGVDLAYRTGTYAPADFYADLTCTAATLDDISVDYGHSVVTKENVSRFGALYTWDQAHKLDEALAKEGRGWRLPTAEDWAKLLNWAEINEDAKNHDTVKSGNFGCVAGNRLKSREYWYVAKPATDPVNDFGMAIYPVGVCPENYNTREPEKFGFTGLYKVASFWTSTICDRDGEPYVRTFSYGHDSVAQFTENRKRRLSIRLVRDIENDFDVSAYADILGNFIPVTLTTDGKQLWTSINVGILNYDGYDQKEITVPEEWKNIDTDKEAVGYYELKESGSVLYYDFENMLDEYDLPSYAKPESIPVYDSYDLVPEPTTADSPYIGVKYMIHLDMLTEAKFFYNAWDGEKWHKKLMREGESVVLLYEDFETSCDTAATPYVTSANTNHEWRVFVNPQTGLDELIDTAEALKGEMDKEFKEIHELISGLTENVNNLSGFVGDIYNEMQSGFTSAFTAISDLQDELDVVEASVGLSGDGSFVVIRESGITASAETIADAIGSLDDALVETIENLDILSGVVEDLAEEIDGLQEEVDNIEDGVGLSSAGTYEMKTDTHYLNNATTVEGEIAELDEVAFSAMTEIEELQKRTIEPLDTSIIVEVSGYTTYVGVKLPDDGMIKVDEEGLYFDGEFKESDDDDEDFYD